MYRYIMTKYFGWYVHRSVRQKFANLSENTQENLFCKKLLKLQIPWCRKLEILLIKSEMQENQSNKLIATANPNIAWIAKLKCIFCFLLYHCHPSSFFVGNEIKKLRTRIADAVRLGIPFLIRILKK